MKTNSIFKIPVAPFLFIAFALFVLGCASVSDVHGEPYVTTPYESESYEAEDLAYYEDYHYNFADYDGDSPDGQNGYLDYEVPNYDDESEHDGEQPDEQDSYLASETESYYDEFEVDDNNDSQLTEAFVSRVIDGDTVELVTGERVRFIGIDTPEIGEVGADEATAFVLERVLNQAVWLEADGNDTDRFGRLRRYVWLELPTDSTDRAQIETHMLNALLLSNGLAEVAIFGEVRNEQLFNEIAIPLVYVATSEQTITEEATEAEYNFIGNRNSEIFHTFNCRTLPAERNRVHFETRDQAIAAGHRACRNCRP